MITNEDVKLLNVLLEEVQIENGTKEFILKEKLLLIEKQIDIQEEMSEKLLDIQDQLNKLTKNKEEK